MLKSFVGLLYMSCKTLSQLITMCVNRSFQFFQFSLFDSRG
ncbi:hypothetical protein Plhal703r1_c07g0039801 [Plasmopara halstedii]